MRYVITSVVCGLLPLACCAADGPTFEVASIKASSPITGGIEAGLAQLSNTGVKSDPAFASFTRVSLRELVARAYRLQPFQVSGPDWMDGTYFDIVAKLPEGQKIASIPEMLQSLLIDRFGLSLHTSTKEFQTYTLRVDTDGVKLPLFAEEQKADFPAGTISRSMDDLTATLSQALGRPVLNQTEREGRYVIPRQLFDALLKRTLWQRLSARPELETVMQVPSESEVQKALSSTAGLLLRRQVLPLPELVVDHVEKKPSDN